MSAGNEGGFAERGNVVGTAGGLAQPGGPNTSSGGTGGNSGSGSGASQSQHYAGPPRRSNVRSAYTGPLNPGVRTSVVPGFGDTRRADQSLGDIQREVDQANARADAANRSGSNSSHGSGGYTTRRVQRRNPRTGVLETVTVKVPVPQPKPGVTPDYRAPYNPAMGPPRPGYTGYGSPFDAGMLDPSMPSDVPDVQSGSFFPGASVNLPAQTNVQSGANFPGGSQAWNGGTAAVSGQGSGWHGMANDFGSAVNAIGNAIGNSATGLGGLHNAASQGWGGAGRQFGGPVDPGREYTVGENGPETLRMAPNGGGQVIPNNPMDRMAGGGNFQGPPGGGFADKFGGMNPQTMQQFFQLLQQNPQMMQRIQQMRQQAQQGGGMMRGQQPGPGGMPRPIPPRPMGPSMGGGYGQQGGGLGQPPAPNPNAGMRPNAGIGGGVEGGGFQLGDWRNRMGIAGLSRPMPSGGFANRGGLGT